MVIAFFKATHLSSIFCLRWRKSPHRFPIMQRILIAMLWDEIEMPKTLP
jgi:hypothetical protein